MLAAAGKRDSVGVAIRISTAMLSVVKLGQLFRTAVPTLTLAVTITQTLTPYPKHHGLRHKNGILSRFSCAIQISPTDCLDDSWRDTRHLFREPRTRRSV